MLLSRVAESLYWINRYLERAENISRFVEVSDDKRFPEKKPDDVINFLIRDRLNPNSIISCKSKQHYFLHSNGKRKCKTN